MRLFASVVCAAMCALVPGLTLADSLHAGFAPSSIFASRTSAKAGESITIFTVLYNSSAENVSGDVIFAIDGNDIETMHFILNAGETQTPAATWTATEGTHLASARIDHVVGSDSNVALAHDRTDTVTLTVSAAPLPSPQAQAVSGASNVIAQGTSYVAPITTNAYSAIESFRSNTAQKLQNIAAASAPKKSSGAVLGASTFKDPNAASQAASSWLGAAWHWLLQALYYVFNIKILFYLVLLVVVYLLFRILMTLLRGGRYS